MSLTDAFAAIDRAIDAVWTMNVEWRTPDDKATADEEALESVKALLSSQSAELDRLRSAKLTLVDEPGREAVDIRRSAFAKAFCETLGG